MYCPTCDEVYKLPENVNIKVRYIVLVRCNPSTSMHRVHVALRIQLYQELTCPLDGFELVLVTFGTGQKRYPLCPFCYNYPVLDNMEVSA